MKQCSHFAYLFLICTSVLGNESFMKPLFNTKTLYFWVKDPAERIPENQYYTLNHNGQTCQLDGLNVLFRHGARFPTIKWIKWMTALQVKLGGDSNVISRYPFIKLWSNPFPEGKEGTLSLVGEYEMLRLANRFAKRFKSSLQGNLNHINFSFTHKNRTQNSYKFFYEGLNETFQTYTQGPLSKVDDEKLRFYDNCHKYSVEVEGNDNTTTEYEAFLHGKEMTNVIRKVETKLGFYNLSAVEVVVVNQICALELGFFNKSDWCKLFDVDDLLVIDYLQNIEDYYEKGYAYPINWKQSCPFTSYMFKTFDHTVSTASLQHNKVPQLDISFGHSETIVPVYTAFGLFHDAEPLMANNFDANKNRTFHGAVIGPFSSNFAVALYKCDGNSDHVIQMFVNEDPVIIPACGKTVCGYSDFKNYYSKLADCNFDQICQNDPHKPAFG